MKQLLKHRTNYVDLGDTGILNLTRTSVGTIEFKISEGGRELAAVQLSNEKAKHVIVTLCQFLGVPFNQSVL